ncbi:Lrp/AsnC family transcriptional regulator [Pinibacter soli]|uniref:Lrp/AsnC family transcriptional regulator n=1 Tax=Pinibacter soli TaxID=3044211 RepID=A0ABT6R9T9_9BACT|nr:Lrp/AsnC family transcriptional regulator [Pinibacter soli]MDI3319324.1 Lrp/AsnC family transcriptional regulator [Pinibacter soli]
MVALDLIDIKILNMLQRDAALSAKAIADKIGLSVSPTYDRINKLKANGIIEKNVILLNREKIGLGVIAYCHLSLKSHSTQTSSAFEEQITVFEEIMEIVKLSGNYDYMLKIVTKDLSTYHDFIESKLAKLSNIANLQTSFVMKELKRETAYKL